MFQYQCYDSECDIKFNDPVERREHCIRIHKFPKKYRFDDMPNYSKKDESNAMEVDNIDSKKKKKNTKVLLNKNQKSKMFTKITTNTVCENANVGTIASTNTVCESTTVETIPSTNVKTKLTTPLAFVPRQVQKSFSKVLTNNQNREKNDLESETMMELADSLPD